MPLIAENLGGQRLRQRPLVDRGSRGTDERAAGGPDKAGTAGYQHRYVTHEKRSVAIADP